MKVSKNVSIDIELLNKAVRKEKSFSKAVSEALKLWLAQEEDVNAQKQKPTST